MTALEETLITELQLIKERDIEVVIDLEDLVGQLKDEEKKYKLTIKCLELIIKKMKNE